MGRYTQTHTQNPNFLKVVAIGKVNLLSISIEDFNCLFKRKKLHRIITCSFNESTFKLLYFVYLKLSIEIANNFTLPIVTTIKNFESK